MSTRPLFASLENAGLWLGVILTGALALCATRPPRPLPASAPPNVFSAARAIAHLQQIAKQPHPIGSDEGARVREFLIAQLRGLGGEVHVEQAVGTVQYERILHSGVVNNIVATFPGRSSSRAIMLAAHYDSVPEGPGAADDGAGLIVILETIRALRAGPPIKNDLVVLFTDGEEARGLLGAQAYATRHPDLADRIGMMLNLEARGSSGPALMFETSNDNGALIRGFARSAPYPMATSLMAAVYKLLPNDTDFTPLKAAGLQGLNFAFIENFQAYHTRLDTIENLDPRTVQQMGGNVLGVVRHFGDLDRPPKERDLIYFNWLGSSLLLYPVWLAWMVAALAPIILAFGCIRAASRIGLTLGRTAAGFGIFFVQLLVFVGGSFAAFATAKLIPGEFLDGDTMSNQLLFAGVTGIGLGLTLISQRIITNKLGMANFAAGQLFAVSFLSLLVCGCLAGGSYVLQWPLLFAMAGMFLGLRLREPARSVSHFVFVIPALLILVPLTYMLFVGLTFNFAGLAATGFLLTSLLALAPLLFNRLTGRPKHSLTIVFLISASLIGAGIFLTRRNVEHPRRDTLIYSVNADENKAKWVSHDAMPDAWTANVLGSKARSHPDPAYTVGLDRPVLTADATAVPLNPPFVAVSQNYVSDGEQTITLQIASRRDARLLVVRLPGALKISAAGWNGDVQPIHDTSHSNLPWTFRFYNAPPEGVTLEFHFPAQNGIKVWIADATSGFSAVAPPPPRPDDTTPGYGSDITLVAGAHDF